MKTDYKIRVAKGILLMLVAFSIASGCCHTQKLRSRCFSCCTEASEVKANVHVGGQVHEPRALEIAADGTNLRRALMTAGGARELAIAGTNTASTTPEATARVTSLMSLAQTSGRFEARQEFVDDHAEEAAVIFPMMTSEHFEEAIQDSRLEFAAMLAELSKSFDSKELNGLVLMSQQRGIAEEQRDLEIKAPGVFSQGRVALNSTLERAVKNEALQLNVILQTPEATATLRSVRSEFLVALNRAAANPPVTYYFPYDLVISGQAGEIELQNGDAVDVVDIRDTELNPQSRIDNGGAANVLIDGYVKNAGIISGVSTIGSVHSRSVRTINDTRSVWMLVRPSPTGVGERVFVLPDRLVKSNGAVADAPALNGDVYMHLILPQVPIVLETLVVRALDARQRKCLDQVHAKKAEIKESMAIRQENRAVARAIAQQQGRARAQAKFGR